MLPQLPTGSPPLLRCLCSRENQPPRPLRSYYKRDHSGPFASTMTSPPTCSSSSSPLTDELNHTCYMWMASFDRAHGCLESSACSLLGQRFGKTPLSLQTILGWAPNIQPSDRSPLTLQNPPQSRTEYSSTTLTDATPLRSVESEAHCSTDMTLPDSCHSQQELPVTFEVSLSRQFNHGSTTTSRTRVLGRRRSQYLVAVSTPHSCITST